MIYKYISRCIQTTQQAGLNNRSDLFTLLTIKCEKKMCKGQKRPQGCGINKISHVIQIKAAAATTGAKSRALNVTFRCSMFYLCLYG